MKYILLIILLSISQLNLYSQSKISHNSKYKNVKIFESKYAGPCEPSIAINKSNINEIVAGSILDFVHISDDGGLTWKTERMSSALGVFGDPCVISDSKNNFYYFHLSDPENKGWSSNTLLDQIVVQRSNDKGKTWTQGKGIGKNYPKQQDKEWAIASIYNDDIYVTWTQFDKYDSRSKRDSSLILFSKSTDVGETWSKAKRISKFAGDCRDDDQTVEGAVPAHGNNNEVYVAWSFNNKIYFNKSTDRGESWMEEEVAIATQPEGWNFSIDKLKRVNGMPVTVCDNSNSKYRNSIYVNWIDHRNGNPDVFICRSVDGGNTWSSPKQINIEEKSAEQFFTWMAIDQTNGNLYIVYYDNSRNEDGSFDVILSTSTDGGSTFTNEVISESSFTPNNKVFFGDYNNIIAHDGIIRPIWTRVKGSKLSIWTAIIDKK